MLAYAEGLDKPPDVSASYCVDRLRADLAAERWALVLDGTEVVQHEQGAWLGRFVHPELGRLLEELASAPLPGVVVLTSRFPMPTLEQRRHARDAFAQPPGRRQRGGVARAASACTGRDTC